MAGFFLLLLVLLTTIEQTLGLPNILKGGTASTTPFDAEAQYVDVTGAHEFQPPGHGDQRGPCPALNAMANHNYLPHNGIASVSQFVNAQVTVFNIGTDLATVLALLGSLLSGNGGSWSIGGPPPDQGLVRQYGISFSHNHYEGDASPTRGDLYMYGNDYKVVLDQFKALSNKQSGQSDADARYDLSLMTDFRSSRFQDSVSKNPYFFNAPFSGTMTLAAAYSLPPAAMSNHSTDSPDGYLDGTVLKSFFSIAGDPTEELTYTEGNERIPYNWYKRNHQDPYSLSRFFGDFQTMAKKDPRFIAIGGNTGTTNSFTGIDVSKASKGVYNAKDLTDPKKVACFGYQAAFLTLPDTLLSVIGQLLATIIGQI